MDYYTLIIKIIDTNIVYCLIPMVLILSFVNHYFKNRFDAKKALEVISWFILAYTALVVIHFILTPDNQTVFAERIKGPYKFIYIAILFSSMLLPFSLFIKKLASKFWYVIVVAYLMKIGLYMELKTIVLTSFHRDYSNNPEILLEVALAGFFIILQSVFMVVVLLAIINFMKWKDQHTQVIDDI